jgi:hypothetical protein
MRDKAVALAQIVEIAERNDLGEKEITYALKCAVTENPGGTVLSGLLAYLGGIFIISGLAVFITMFWEDMNTAAHLIVTLGAGIAALVLAIQSLSHDRYSKVATPLFLIAAALQSTGIMVAFEELGTGGDPQVALLAMTVVMTLQMLAVFWKYQRDALLFFALVFGAASFGNAYDLMDMDDDLITLIVGLSLLFVTAGIDRTTYRSITPFWYFAGSAMFLWAGFELLEHTPFHVLYLGLTAFTIYISTVTKSRTLLFVSTVAMISYLGYFTYENFVDSAGWPLVLIVMGLVLTGLSSVAIKINKKYIAS